MRSQAGFQACHAKTARMERAHVLLPSLFGRDGKTPGRADWRLACEIVPRPSVLSFRTRRSLSRAWSSAGAFSSGGASANSSLKLANSGVCGCCRWPTRQRNHPASNGPTQQGNSATIRNVNFHGLVFALKFLGFFCPKNKHRLAASQRNKGGANDPGARNYQISRAPKGNAPAVFFWEPFFFWGGLGSFLGVAFDTVNFNRAERPIPLSGGEGGGL